MENKNTVITIIISAVLSSACTAAILKLSSKQGLGDDQNLGAIKSKIEQLEQTVALEIQARVSLEQQLANVTTPIVTKQNSVVVQTNEQAEQQAANQESRDEATERFRRERAERREARRQPGYRQQQLVSAGFEPTQAARIVQLESLESLRNLQTQYDARRQYAQTEEGKLRNANPIREELGDEGYQRYLEANDLSTSAQIGSIIGGSAGENAGLLAGDKIVSYAGERVFNLNDVNNLTVLGELGESILIEIERDGTPLQLTIPRGPIGVRNRF